MIFRYQSIRRTISQTNDAEDGVDGVTPVTMATPGHSAASGPSVSSGVNVIPQSVIATTAHTPVHTGMKEKGVIITKVLSSFSLHF